jgi:hypothetical protein
VVNSGDMEDCPLARSGLGLLEALSKSKTLDMSRDDGSIESNMVKLGSLLGMCSSIFHEVMGSSVAIISPEVLLVSAELESAVLLLDEEDEDEPRCMGREKVVSSWAEGPRRDLGSPKAEVSRRSAGSRPKSG